MQSDSKKQLKLKIAPSLGAPIKQPPAETEMNSNETNLT